MSDERVVGGRYAIEKVIGSGGLGVVFRGVDRTTDQPVAIKELQRNLLNDDPSVLERFEREVSALARLEHPNIVKILDTVREEGRYYLVMEYLDQGSLADMLQRQPQLPLEQIVQLALDLSDALIRAHRQHIIHRDIKPANVLLAADGTPRLADFNVAYISDLSGITQVGARIGTYAYMSPEALRGEPPNPRTDIWAFGVMLFELLSGRRPFFGENAYQIEQAVLHHPLPDIQQLRPDVPLTLAGLIREMLDKDPVRRTRSMRKVGEQLEDILHELRSGAAADDLHNLPTLLAREPAALTERFPWYGAAEYTHATGQSMITLDVTVEEAQGSYTVSAGSTRNGSTIEPRPIEPIFDADGVPPFEAELTRWVQRFSAMQDLHQQSHLQQAEEIGRRLFAQLFDDQAILRLFEESYAEVKHNRLHGQTPDLLRLRLKLPPSLSALPWELLFYQREGSFLAHNPMVTVARTVGSASPNMLSPVQGVLRIVLVLAQPSDLAPIDLYAQVKPFHAAVSRLMEQGIEAEVETIDGPGTWQKLHNRLNQPEPVHILQFICHGMFDDNALGEGVLAFESQQGTRHKVSASLLRDLLNTHRHLVRLVFLVACQSGTAERGNPFSSISEVLARGGTPAVVAMQFKLRQDVAKELIEAFYQQLATHNPIDKALTVARLAIKVAHSEHLYWAVPVLFLHSGGEVILGRPAQAPLTDEGHTLLNPASPSAAARNDHLTNVFPNTAERPMIARNNSELRAAELAVFERRWHQAVEVYRRLTPRFRLPAEHLSKMTAAEREVERMDLLAAVTLYERQENWPEVIGHLERHCQRYTSDVEALRRLDRAREEQRIIELGLEAARHAEALDWDQVLALLDKLDMVRPGYTALRSDLKSLRREALSELAYERVTSAIDDERLDEGLVELERLPADYITDQLRQLKRVIQNKLDQQAEDRRRQLSQRLKELVRQSHFAEALAVIRAEQGNITLRPTIQESLAEMSEAPTATLEERLQAAQLACSLGDARPGVIAPPLAMVTFAGGLFQIGSTTEEIELANKQHQREQQGRPHPQPPREWSNDERNHQSVNVPGWAISRYLVTNALFQQFMEAKGYDPDRHWWDEYSRNWLIHKRIDRPGYWNDARLGQQKLNHPVVGVSWFEAQAFCAWLSLDRTLNPLGVRYRLPSEIEWEFAARGSKRRLYPWGYKEPERGRANFGEQFSGTSSVGCFIEGNTPEGLCDMAGNVWEWTGSIYGPYPFLLSNNHVVLKSDQGVRITVRGGGWTSQPTLLRAAHRYYYAPSEMKRFLGFRVVCDLPAQNPA